MSKWFMPFFLTFFLLIGVGCGPLRKSQVRLIGNYYNTLTNYPGNVRKLNERVAKLTLESDNLRSSLHPSDSLRVGALVTAINEYQANLALPDSILLEVDFLDNYMRGYYVLVPNGFNIYKALKGTSESIGGMFGLKPVVSSILPDKSVEITNAKKRKILAHFQGQSEGLHQCLTEIKSYIDTHSIPEIDRTSQKMQADMQLLFLDRNGSVSSVDHYFNYNRHFISFFQKLIQTRKLYASVSKSLTNILETEMEIQRMTVERNKVYRDSYQLHILVSDMQKMQALLAETTF